MCVFDAYPSYFDQTEPFIHAYQPVRSPAPPRPFHHPSPISSAFRPVSHSSAHYPASRSGIKPKLPLARVPLHQPFLYRPLARLMPTPPPCSRTAHRPVRQRPPTLRRPQSTSLLSGPPTFSPRSVLRPHRPLVTTRSLVRSSVSLPVPARYPRGCSNARATDQIRDDLPPGGSVSCHLGPC